MVALEDAMLAPNSRSYQLVNDWTASFNSVGRMLYDCDEQIFFSIKKSKPIIFELTVEEIEILERLRPRQSSPGERLKELFNGTLRFVGSGFRVDQIIGVPEDGKFYCRFKQRN